MRLWRATRRRWKCARNTCRRCREWPDFWFGRSGMMTGLIGCSGRLPCVAMIPHGTNGRACSVRSAPDLLFPPTVRRALFILCVALDVDATIDPFDPPFRPSLVQRTRFRSIAECFSPKLRLLHTPRAGASLDGHLASPDAGGALRAVSRRRQPTKAALDVDLQSGGDAPPGRR